MDFRLSTEQQALQAETASFIEANYQPEERREIAFSDSGFDRNHWQQLCKSGWFGSNHKSRSLLDFCLIAQQLGVGLFPSPLIESICLSGTLLRTLGTEEQQQNHLVPLLAGEELISAALFESDCRWNLKNISSSCLVNDQGYVLNGVKSMVNWAAQSDQIMVAARNSGKAGEEQGLSLFLIPVDCKGVSINQLKTQTGTPAAQVEFDNVVLSHDSLIGQIDDAYSSLNTVFNQASVVLSAFCVGAMQGSVDWTIKHLKARQQFDTPLSDFQALQHRVVDMFTRVQEAESLLYLSALKVEANDNADLMSSAVKSRVGRSGRFVGENMIQLHGGWGMRDDHRAGQFLKAMMAVDAQFGNADFHTHRFINATAN